MGLFKELFKTISDYSKRETDDEFFDRIGRQAQAALDAQRDPDCDLADEDDELIVDETYSYRIEYTSDLQGAGQVAYITTSREITSNEQAKVEVIKYYKLRNPGILNYMGRFTVDSYMDMTLSI
ncbi:MAG: hypothetical protein IKK05_04490 [Alistipes sp.]|nr:hypothetical protein [Alistipes sp.]